MASLNATDEEPHDANRAYYIAYACLYSLGALYLVPSAISWTRMTRNLYTEDRTAVRLFSLLGLGSLLRALAFDLVALWMFAVIRSHGTTHEARHLHLSYVQLVIAWQVLGMLGSFVLVSVFLLVFNTWATMIEQVASSSRAIAHHGVMSRRRASRPDAPPPRLLFIRMVLATNAFQLLMFLLVNVVPTSQVAQTLNLFATSLLAACFAVCIVLLPSYGQRMCDLLGKVADGADRRQRNIRRIAAISTVFCIMRTLSEVLLAMSEFQQQQQQFEMDGAGRNGTDDTSSSVGPFRIPLRHIVEANPIFFFTSDGSAMGQLRWVVLLEVVAFPVEWALLMLLLFVLPSRTVLPSIRGYQSIPDLRRRLQRKEWLDGETLTGDIFTSSPEMTKSPEEKRDIYYRRAKEVGFRARSAFKLLQLDEQFAFLKNVERAVDLCAAPGSWSQVLSRKLYHGQAVIPTIRRDMDPADAQDVRVVSVDLQEMAPIPGVALMQGDITSKRTAEQIIAYFHGRKAQIVVSDGAPDVTGVHDIDEFVQAELLAAALNITTHVLEEGGTFVAKIFRCQQYDLLADQLSNFFSEVSCSKPTSSRAQSNESFVVAQGFKMPADYTPVMTSYLLPRFGLAAEEPHDPVLVPYLACGDLSGFDKEQEFF
ncbi:hypothetical protein ATCC90586_006403 [Pythium insidiosum]|nr:hypothetical protein ATCC90586_006403 [Pythium insidiosum]